MLIVFIVSYLYLISKVLYFIIFFSPAYIAYINIISVRQSQTRFLLFICYINFNLIFRFITTSGIYENIKGLEKIIYLYVM